MEVSRGMSVGFNSVDVINGSDASRWCDGSEGSRSEVS